MILEILIRHGETPPAHPAPGDCRSVGQSVCRSVLKHKKLCFQSMERWRVLGNPLGAVQPQVVHRLNLISPARPQLGGKIPNSEKP